MVPVLVSVLAHLSRGDKRGAAGERRMLQWLKPPMFIEAIQDKAQAEHDYRYWRRRVFYSIFIGYTFYYFTRKSLTFAMPALSRDLGFDKSELGILLSVLSISYGISKFVSGISGDRSNARYFMATGLVITGILNICFGFASSLWLFAILWGLNGWFQGFGFAPAARILTHWYSKKERGFWWALWSTSHNVGGALIPIIVAYCVTLSGWRAAMWIPGLLCLFSAFFVINRLRDTPQSLGLPSIEKFNGEEGAHESANERELSVSEILWKYVLVNPAIWFLAGANFFVYEIRSGINDWTVFYLVETSSLSELQASTTVSWFEVGGLLGMIAAGWASDKIFNGFRGGINILLMLFTAVPVGLFWFSAHQSLILDSTLMFLIGFFLFGPQMLIGCTAAEQSHKKAAATASGFAGCFAYLGAAVSGYPFGTLAHRYGWDAFFVALVIAVVLGALCFVPIWYQENFAKSARRLVEA